MNIPTSAQLGREPAYPPREVRSVLTNKTYRLIDKIGSGSFSDVFRVVCQGGLYALKMYKQQQDEGVSNLQQAFPLENEIEIHRQLVHPSIVKHVDYGAHEQRSSGPEGTQEPSPHAQKYAFLVNELVDHDLGGLLADGAEFQQREVKTIMRQLLQGLAELHKRNIIHRDIKPNNILYSNEGTVKIADFGVATKYQEGDQLDVRLQNINYRAPELIMGVATYTTKLDIYNLGVVLWRLFTGKPMWDFSRRKPDVMEVISLHGSDDWEQWAQEKGGVYEKILCLKFPRRIRQELRQLAPEYVLSQQSLPQSAVAFVDRLLQVRPERRPDVDEALKDPYFSDQPAGASEQEMPAFTDNHYCWRPPPQREFKRYCEQRREEINELLKKEAKEEQEVELGTPTKKKHRQRPQEGSKQSEQIPSSSSQVELREPPESITDNEPSNEQPNLELIPRGVTVAFAGWTSSMVSTASSTAAASTTNRKAEPEPEALPVADEPSIQPFSDLTAHAVSRVLLETPRPPTD